MSARACQDCGTPMTLLETSHGGQTTFRKMECKCGSRFESEEKIARRLPPAAARTRRQAPAAVEAPPPTPTPADPPSSDGGIGGPLPVVPLSLSLTSPDPNPISSGDPKRGRARNKTPANPMFGPMRDTFIVRWEERYEDKYIFQAKDAACLSRMLRDAPHLVERWPDMVERYLADAFWATKRHPLTGLTTRPVEFAGDADAPVRQDKWADSRRTAVDWARRNVG